MLLDDEGRVQILNIEDPGPKSYYKVSGVPCCCVACGERLYKVPGQSVIVAPWLYCAAAQKQQ